MSREKNKELAEIFRKTALMIEILEDDTFRARAFERAALTVEGLEEDICDLSTKIKLETLPGIGKSISRHITEWCYQGTFAEHEKLKASFPPGLMNLLVLPGLGVKKVKSLYTQLGVTSIGELEYACLENRLAGIKGFGLKSQQKILSAIEEFKAIQKFRLAPDAYALAEEIIDMLRRTEGINDVRLIGALRRFREYTDDVDLLVDARGSEWIDSLINGKILSNVSVSLDDFGNMRVTGIFGGMTVDIRRSSGTGAFFVYTGSRDHIEALIHVPKKAESEVIMTVDTGSPPNRFGIIKDLFSMDFKDETELYKHFGLAFIPPELREGLDEIDAALKDNIPSLIELGDIKGIFHIHTTASDGSLELERIVRLCLERGYDYVGISDHSVSAYYAGGLTEDKLKKQREEVESLRERYPQIDIYWGIESDIRSDGSLDYPDRILEDFDFVIGSVHGNFKMDRKAMTERIIKALRHPCLTMLGHPTGRLILGRSGYEIDVDALLETAKEYHKIIELNAHPHRLDLDWKGCKKAKILGIPVSINPDAHNLEDFSLRYGILTARKGWLTASDVWNASSRESMKNLMKTRPWRS